MSRKAPPRPGRRAAGDTPPDIAAMIRVDHAGELGAVRIYAGQRAVLGASPATARTAALVAHMAEQEDAHLKTFDTLIRSRGVRPTALTPLWHVAGYALGAVTALMGEKAAMACTEAVEEVIDDHYAQQEERLKGRDPELARTIAQFRADEIAHRDLAREEGAAEAAGYPVLKSAIKAGCRLAIRLSERL